MYKVMSVALGTLAIAMGAVPAHAVTNLGNTDLTGLDQNASPNFFYAQFAFSSLGGAYPVDPTGYTKTFTFDFPLDGVGAGSVTTNLVGGANTIFTSVIFNGQAFTLNGTGTQASLASAPVNKAPPGSNVLTVNFKVNDFNQIASFEGDISAMGVPEPATWGLMILGLGFAGAALRRRRHIRLRFA